MIQIKLFHILILKTLSKRRQKKNQYENVLSWETCHILIFSIYLQPIESNTSICLPEINN